MGNIIITRKESQREGYKRFYIGRPSPLGNPYELNALSGLTRTAAIREYRIWLRQQIAEDNQQVINKLTEIKIALLDSDVALDCHCTPMICHGEVIKEYLETGKI